jgi:predicted dehydrogenase
MVASNDRIELGVIGVNEGNGHPYSFASIVNGYSDAGFAAADWDVIHDYLREKDDSEFGFPGVEVTHAWTQDEAETERLCRAARIPNAVSDREDMVGAVDGVLLLRDDHEVHLEIAKPFLEAGHHVFVDKPLSTGPDELREFRPYLESGTVTSCSGMRYARELDAPRSDPDRYGRIKLVRGAIIKGWERYGIHLLDGIFNVVDRQPVSVTAVGAGHPSMAIRLEDDALVQIDALGDVSDAFDVTFYGTDLTTSHRIRDNFTAFRRTLWRFIQTIRTGDPVIPPEHTVKLMCVLIAGNRSHRSGEPVAVDDVTI